MSEALGKALKTAIVIAENEGDGTLTITKMYDGMWEWMACFGPIKQFDNPVKQRLFEERLIRSKSLKTAIEKCCLTLQGIKTSRYNRAITELSEKECEDIILSDEIIPNT